MKKPQKELEQHKNQIAKTIKKYLAPILLLPGSITVYILSRLAKKVYPLFVNKIVPELDKEFLIELLILCLIVITILFAICIFLIIQINKKPIIKIIDSRNYELD